MADAAERKIAFMGNTQKVLDKWPEDVREIVKTNLQALQESKRSSFCNLPDWAGHTKVSDKALQGAVEGARQLTIKHRQSYRVVYIAEYDDVVVVLHCFKKQKEGRQNADMETVAERLKVATNRFS